MSQLGDSFTAKFYKDGTLAETFSGTIGTDGSLPLGLVKLKQGTYSVELTSGGTTLTPFKATIKPSSILSTQELKEKDSTFQQLPQSASQPIDTTGNAPLPEQIDLVTEDNKSKAANQVSYVDIEDLPKSQNQPLDNPRTFLTADQVNGQKEVQIEGSPQVQSNQINQSDRINNHDALKTVQIGEIQSEKSTEISSNQPLPESNESFSSNQILPNAEQNTNVDNNINNPLPTSNEQINKNNTTTASEGFNVTSDGAPISQNLPLNSVTSAAVSQNAPLGLNSDGTPISQTLVDINGVSVSGNRPLENSSETFTSVTPLISDEDTNTQSGMSVGYSDLNKTTEYEKLPEISQPIQVDQTDNQVLSPNTPFAESVEYSSEAQKLSDTTSVITSRNIGFEASNEINYSENQKLLDSTSLQKSKTEGSNDSDAGYQKLPDNTNVINNQDDTLQENQNQSAQGFQNPSRLNYNNISQNNELQSSQTSQLPGQETRPGQTSQLPGQEISRAASQQMQSGENDQLSKETLVNGNQIRVPDFQNSDNHIGDTNLTNDITTSADPKTVSGNITDENVDKLLSQDGKSPEYITRTIGATTESAYETEEIYEEQQSSNRILSSSLMQSGNIAAGENRFISNNESSISLESGYVKVGETSLTGTNNQLRINNFNFDTDMPDEFYSYKGSRTIPNSELLEEFIKSEQFTKLDEATKSTVLSARQSLQLPAFNPQISQEQPGVTSGTTLQGNQSLQATPINETRGLGKLFSRNRQDRPERKSDKTQEQIQKEFEEANGLKQKISLTLNKVFGNSERSIGLPQYSDGITQNTAQAYEQLQNNFDDEDIAIGEEDYQFGDEDKIYSSPRITGVRETLDEDYQEELRKRRRRRRNLRYLPVGADLESKFLPINDDKAYESLPEDEETNLYRQFTGERDRFQALNISEQEQNKIALRKAEHDIQQELNKALEENINIKESAENQATEASADAETVFYKELIKERERFQQALLEEREQNKAALRRSEDQIQRQLIDVLTSNPQAAPAQSSNDPISQVVRSLVDSGKDKEEIIIDATRIIQMIQNTQSESGAQEIDEYLLRQRIERELKYEFKQMQLEHEQKMKLIYRRMIEDMYIDMLNS